MITRGQMVTLRELAKQVKYKVVREGQYLRLESKCTTEHFANDIGGYQNIKQKLELIISRSKNATNAS